MPGWEGMPMYKVLLTNAMGPYKKGWGEDITDLFGARLTRGQGPFRLKSFFYAFALYLIAENIKAQTTVIEWPTEDVLRMELAKGYDYFGIQMKTVHFPAYVRMVKIAREVAPQTKIVLGGYGVMHIYNKFPSDPEKCADFLLENADHICYEEGIGFFRKILGQDANAPVTQRLQPGAEVTLRGAGYFVRFPISSTLVALGCPNACEFCTTTAFFKYKKITVSTPEQTFEALKHAHAKNPKAPPMVSAIWDEDFLLEKDYVLRLGELLRKDDLIGRIALFCFGSIRSISQYSAEELVRCGIGVVWIGVESKFDECITSEHSFQKRSGRDVAEVFDDLHRHGILVIGSNMLGLDFHNRENILEDIDYFVSLKPDLFQVSPVSPCPGTVFFERLQESGRIQKFTYEDATLWSDNMIKYDNFERDEIRKFFDIAHEKLYKTNGPTILNVLDVMLQGYRTMHHATDPHLQARAEKCYFMAKKIGGTVLYAIKKMAPSDAVRMRAEEVEERYLKYIGQYSMTQKVAQRVVYGFIKVRSRIKDKGDVSDPPYEISYYKGDGTEPEVVARRDPVRSFIARRTVSLTRNLIGLKHKPVFNIRLQDIDDFPVTFKKEMIEGHLMNYVDEGQGEILLMLHGNPTWSYLYRHMIKELKKDYRCIALDHLGYGLSDKPADADYSMEAHIRRLGQFVEKLNLKDITLICQDWGGIIGLGYAAKNKERFSRLIPMNTTGFLPETLGEFWRCFGKAWAFPYLWSYKIPIVGKRMGMDWNVFLLAGMWLGTHNRRRQMHRKAMLGYRYPFQRVCDRTAILKSVRQVPMVPFGPVWNLLKETGTRLKGWDVRTQIIWGMKDPVFVPWFVDKFEEMLPNHATTLKIPTASHFLQDDEPEIIMERIRGFLAEAL